MFCYKCGQEVPDKSEFCLKCGENLSLLIQMKENSCEESGSNSESKGTEKKSAKKKKAEKEPKPPKAKKEKKTKPEKRPVSPWVAAFCSVFVTICGLIVGFIYGISNDLTETMPILTNSLPQSQSGNKVQTENVMGAVGNDVESKVETISNEIYGDLLETIALVARNGFDFDYESLGLPQTLPLFLEHAERLGYAFYDANHDGIDEVFIGLEGETGSIMAFTTVDDEIFLISAVEEGYGSSFTSNGTFYHWGSDSAYDFSMSESRFSHVDPLTNIPVFEEIQTYMALSWLSLPEEQWSWYHIPSDYGYVSEGDDVSLFTAMSDDEMSPFYERVQDGFVFDFISLDIAKEEYEFYDFSYVSSQFAGLEIPDFIAFATDGTAQTAQTAYEANTPGNYALYQYDGTFLSSQSAYVEQLKEYGFEAIVDGNEGFYCLTQEIEGVLVQIETYYATYTSMLTVKISLSSPRTP